jgi:hypothetical protein
MAYFNMDDPVAIIGQLHYSSLEDGDAGRNFSMK